MDQARYWKLMKKPLIITGIFLIPGLAGWMTLFSFGFAAVLNTIMATISVYGLALWPAIRFGTAWAWIASLALVVILAFLPGLLAQRYVAQELPLFNEDAAMLGDVRTVEIQSHLNRSEIGECIALCSALLAGGQVEEVRLRGSRNFELTAFLPGESGPIGPRFSDTSLRSDLKIEITEGFADGYGALWQRWMFRVSRGTLYRGIDVGSGAEVFVRQGLIYRRPLTPSAFIVGGGGPYSSGIQTGLGFIPLRRVRSDFFGVLEPSLAALSIPLGVPIEKRDQPEPGPKELFERAASALRMSQPLQWTSKRAVLAWAKEMDRTYRPTEEEVAVFGLIFDRLELDGSSWLAREQEVFDALMTVSELRRAYFGFYFDALVNGGKLEDKFVRGATGALAQVQLEPELAEVYRTAFEAHLREIFAGQVSRTEMVVLSSSVAYGFDAVALLRDLRSSTWRRDPRNTFMLTYVYCISSSEGRRALAGDIIAGAAAEAPTDNLFLRSAEPVLHNIRALGFRPEIEKLMALYDQNPETAANLNIDWIQNFILEKEGATNRHRRSLDDFCYGRFS